jgi:hypothetical protein
MSITSTGLSGEERRGGRNGKTPVLIPTNVDCIRSIRETAAILGIGEMSLRALIAKGLGPQVTRLSALQTDMTRTLECGVTIYLR